MSSPSHTAERPWSAGAPVPRDGRLLGTPSEGPCPRPGRDELVSLLEQAGLTGRGGAGFPTARKLAGVSSQRSRPVVVGNAMEGEELSRKDEALLQLNPALVLDGLDVLSHAVGARRTVLAIGSQIDTRAVRAEAGSRRSPVEVLSFPDAFVAGQESALVNRINNRAAIPSDPLRPVWQHGVDGRPTMVTNAETLAQLALVVRYGPGWFRDAGTQADPGTFLATVSGSSRGIVANPGVVEIARGTRLLDLLKVCGTDLDSIGGILVGGYHGGWLPPAALDVPLSREGLAEFGASPGAGVVHVLDRRHCPLRVAAYITRYLAGESAGQCGPCVNGMPRLAEAVETLSRPGATTRLPGEIARIQTLVTGRGACAHPDGTARFVASTMRTFSRHVQDHLTGRCPT